MTKEDKSRFIAGEGTTIIKTAPDQDPGNEAPEVPTTNS